MIDLAATDPIAFLQSTCDFSKEKIEEVEAMMLERYGKADLPVEHRFAPGVYMRTIFMPRGALVIGHQHNTEHANVVISGRALVVIGGKLTCYSGGDVFNSGVGARKILFIVEDMHWMTIHPTNETDILKLEEQLVTPSQAFKLFKTLVNERQPQLT